MRFSCPIGRLNQGREQELAERYRSGFRTSVASSAFAARDPLNSGKPPRATPRPGYGGSARLRRRTGKSVCGAGRSRKSIDRATFARQLGGWRDEGIANTIFVIGGADGLSPDLQRKAKLRIAFGSATWPHQMVRVMLLEQIYRAATILAGHPYHRA